MGPTRRLFLFGGTAGLAVAGGSAVHQTLLWGNARRAPSPTPRPIPVFDLRGSDPATHALARAGGARDLANACTGPLTPLARMALQGADAVASRWLARTGTPYLGELARIAEGTGIDGVHLLNASYEWGCTSLAAPSPGGDTARLLRTLDWPFHGLGRLVELWVQSGSAGDFVNLSWPGSVGLLTGMAPGRFAAAINQPPVKRRAPGDSPVLDAVYGAVAAWGGSDRIPALHLLRHVFETAPGYAVARELLERTPLAAPAIFTLVGIRPGETCVIERDVDGFATQEGVASAANVWRYSRFPGEWRGGRASEDAMDSDERSTMIEGWAGRGGEPFAWVKAPVLNAMTRLAVEADPARGTVTAMGFEEAPGDGDSALPATLPLAWDAAGIDYVRTPG